MNTTPVVENQTSKVQGSQGDRSRKRGAVNPQAEATGLPYTCHARLPEQYFSEAEPPHRC